MADEQLKNLTATTTPADTDILYTVVDPAGTPLDRKITWTSIKAFLKTYFDGLYEKLTNKVTSFQVTPDDTHYPSEKLVKDNLDLLSDESFYAGTMTVNAGTLNTGTVTDLQAVGGTDVNIQESSGANPLTVTFDFTGVTKLSAFVFFGYYAGGSGHQLDIEIYNHLTTNWDNLGLVGSETSKKWYSFPIYNTNSYINAGAVSVRIRHIQTGNITHQLILDYLELNYGGAGGSGNISASSVNFIPSGDLSSTNVASALSELDTEKISKAGGSLTGVLNEIKGADIASASSIDIGAGTGNFIDITGTTTITALGTIQEGTERTLRFTGILTLTHNATSLILPTGANITTQAGDVAKFRSLGSGNWVCVSYLRKDGTALDDKAFMYRQAIINGNFDVWQRGTSVAVGGGGYTVDRWYALRGNTTAGSTVSRQDGTGVNGSYYCARIQRDSGNSSTEYLSIAQYLEGSIRLRGKTITLSFYARKGADYTATSDILEIQIATGTAEDSRTMTGAIASSNIILTTSWQLFTLTTEDVVDSNVASLRVYFQYNVTGTASTNDYFEIAQVQLCAGSVALPFQPKSFAEELRDCQRYCYGITTVSATEEVAQGHAISTTVSYPSITLPVTMRTIPTLTTATATDWQLDDGTTSPTNVTALVIDDLGFSNTRKVVLKASAGSGLTAFRPYYLVGDGNTGRVLILSAEL